MFSEDKVTEFFFIANEFCKFFNHMLRKCTLDVRPSSKNIDTTSLKISTQQVVLPTITLYRLKELSL